MSLLLLLRRRLLDPRSISGLLYNADASREVYAADAAVTQITDWSGNGYHAPQATSSKQAIYKTGILNGRPVFRLGSDDGYQTGVIDYASSQSLTAFAVSSAPSGSVRIILESSDTFVGKTDAFVMSREASNFPAVAFTGNVGLSNQSGDTTLTTTAGLVTALLDKTRGSGEATIYQGGLFSAGALGSSNNTNTFGNYVLNIGARNNAASNFLNGDIAEILIYSRRLTDTEIVQVETYLGVKWGVAYPRALPIPQTPLLDNTYSVTGANYTRCSPLSRLGFTTDATKMTVLGYCDQIGDPELAVREAGADKATLTAGAGSNIWNQALTAGSKTVEVINGPQRRDSGAPNPITGTFLTMVKIPQTATYTPQAAYGGGRITVYGDSISVGDSATNALLSGIWQLVRNAYSGDLNVDAWGSRSLYDDANTPALRAAFVAQLLVLSPTIICIAIGTNDYGLNKWTAAAFGTALAAVCDDIHTALPGTLIYLISPVPRVSPAVETANGNGSTLANYRTQESTIAAARSGFVTFMDNSALTLTYAADGVHPNTAGHLTYANAVKAVLGI